MKLDEEQYLAHYGILRRSGRYPWGSGGDQNTRNKMFLDHVNDLKNQGLSEVDIARGLGIGKTVNGEFHPSTTQLRAVKSIAKNQQKQAQIGMAQRLKDKGNSNVAIGKRMGINESSVRALLAPGAQNNADILVSTKDMLKREVADKKYVMLGAGVESQLGISKERLNTAVAMLQEEGYVAHRGIKVRQIGTGLDTEMKVLTPPGTTWKEVAQNKDKIQLISSFSENGGQAFGPVKKHAPVPISPDRVQIKYGSQGGATADGVIYVRPGVDDVSLGSNRYAQVRIKIGNDHYLKGMAMYKDGLPAGTDLLFNTKKENTGNKLDAMKPLEADPEYPFGSVTRPLLVNAGDPKKEHVVSAMNMVNVEGDWATWSKTLSSQMLSKQNPKLAKAQLDVTFERRKKELADINALTNPTVKKKLLMTYADSTDSAAVHLKAAALPRTSQHAILPIDSMPPGQIYAPRYNDGERVVLIRHPHGGTFEIPELTVNNRHAEAKRLLGDAEDAVGIHHSVADRLSGADFDGDTVLVIPNNAGKVRHTAALESLKGFDPHSSYKAYDGMPEMTSREKGIEMGKISNLITDMTIHNAPHNEIAQAVRHSMVVIDAEKHHLNYKQSAIDNGISQLKAKYQGGSRAGASTLISKAGARVLLPETKPRPHKEGGPIDPTTGRKMVVETGRTKPGPNGQPIPQRKQYERLAITDDAHSLSSGTLMETIYGDHSNKLKDLANQARLSALKTPRLESSPSAKRAYASEVQSLNSKLTLALRNAPLERQAQLVANTVVKAKRDANPHLEGDSFKKIKFQALTEARIRMGAKKHQIEITPKEWQAIQAGAISDSKLGQIINNSKVEDVRKLATPRVERKMTANNTSRAKAMLDRGATRAEVARQLGVSLTTLDTAIKGGA